MAVRNHSLKTNTNKREEEKITSVVAGKITRKLCPPQLPGVIVTIF